MTSRTVSWQFSPGGFAADLGGDIKQWLAERGRWWATSVVVHALILSASLLLLGTVAIAPAARTDLVTLTAEPVEAQPDEPDIVVSVLPPIDQPPAESLPDLTADFPPPGQTLDRTEVTAKDFGDGGPDKGWTDGIEPRRHCGHRHSA